MIQIIIEVNMRSLPEKINFKLPMQIVNSNNSQQTINRNLTKVITVNNLAVDL